MKIQIVKPYGYCLGVNNAIEISKKIKAENSDQNVVILGMLVHNLDALKELEQCGIKTIYENGKTYEELLNKIHQDDIVILSAHGHDHKIERYLIDNAIKYFDATCPFVKLTHQKIIAAISSKKEVIYIGKKNHPEAIGALSLSKQVYLYDIDIGMNFSELNSTDPVIIAQTTFSNLEIQNIVKKIKEYFPKATFINSVCNASSLRQNALLNLDKNVELIYVIGGKNSNNTKTLYNVAKDNFKDAKIINIENKDDINKKDLEGLNFVALVSGASTPHFITEEIFEFLSSLN